MRDVGVDPKKVFEDALELTPEQRVLLAELLQESVAPPDGKSEADLTAAIVRRAKEVEAGTATLVDLEDVRRELEARFRKP